MPKLGVTVRSLTLFTCNGVLFPEVKALLKVTRFESVDVVKQKVMETINILTENYFQHAAISNKSRWNHIWIGQRIILKGVMSEF